MNFKLLLYAFMLLATVFAMSGINFTGFFRANHKLEAKILVILIAMGISYLATQFILSIIE